MSSDVTFNQVISFLENTPKEAVTLETVLQNVLQSIATAVGATKNAALCKQVDTALEQIYTEEVAVNGIATNIANWAKGLSVYAMFIGGLTIPDSGAVVAQLQALVTRAESWKTKTLSDNASVLAEAKTLLAQFVAVGQSVIDVLPGVGTYAVGGVSVSQILALLTQIGASV
ncbi:MAG: hypothetical protein ABSC15_15465 [Terriglobales bacterium]|jgi:hypothetical protein